MYECEAASQWKESEKKAKSFFCHFKIYYIKCIIKFISHCHIELCRPTKSNVSHIEMNDFSSNNNHNQA